jgi:8-oxo-dGTP pyrophosphatase MutT (NUDIX family)
MKRPDGSFVVIFKDDSRKEVFLVLRSDKPIWNLPGGGIEGNESPENAALRETFEETGGSSLDFTYTLDYFGDWQVFT